MSWKEQNNHLNGMQGRIKNAMFIVVDLQLEEMLARLAVQLEFGAGKPLQYLRQPFLSLHTSSLMCHQQTSNKQTSISVYSFSKYKLDLLNVMTIIKGEKASIQRILDICINYF
jgi:hypothetical protein